MGLSANRRESDEKRLENRAGSPIIARRPSHPGSSRCDQESQMAKNKANDEHRPSPVRVCEAYCLPT